MENLKVFTVTSGKGMDRVTQQVTIRSIMETETLTPRMAKQAAHIAYGNHDNVTVDDGVHCYHLYARSHRFIF